MYITSVLHLLIHVLDWKTIWQSVDKFLILYPFGQYVQPTTPRNLYAQNLNAMPPNPTQPSLTVLKPRPRLSPSNALPLPLLLLLHRPRTLLILKRKVRRPLIRSSPLTPAPWHTAKHNHPQAHAEQRRTRRDPARKRERPSIRQLRVQIESREEVVYRGRQQSRVGVRIGFRIPCPV